MNVPYRIEAVANVGLPLLHLQVAVELDLEGLEVLCLLGCVDGQGLVRALAHARDLEE